jgi:hypothetical protein
VFIRGASFLLYAKSTRSANQNAKHAAANSNRQNIQAIMGRALIYNYCTVPFE